MLTENKNFANQESGIRNQRSIIPNLNFKSSFSTKKIQNFLIISVFFYYLRGASLDTLNSLELRRTTNRRRK